MHRLKSTYTLLSNERPRAHHQDDSHKQPLEQFSWAQILSVEPSTFQLEDSGVGAFDYQNCVPESDEQHNCKDTTNIGTIVLNQLQQESVEHRSDDLLLEQGDVVEHPHEIWNEHPKEHSEEASQSPFENSSIDESEASYDVGGRLRPLQRDSRRRHQMRTREEHSEEASQSPFDISYGSEASSYDVRGLVDRPLQTNVRQLHTREEHSERVQSQFDNSSYESAASYNFGGLVDRPFQRDVSTTPYPVVNPHGSVSLLLRHLVRVDVTPGGAVCIHSIPGNSVITTNSSGDKTCVFHPNSRVFQDGPCVHVMTYDSRIAKICEKGVVFAPSSRRLAYRVDESGTKTTVDKFFDMRDVLVLNGVFCDELGDRSIERCHVMAASTQHRAFPNGDDVWAIGDAQIKQNCYGNVEVSMVDYRRLVGNAEVRDYRRHVLSVLPATGDVSVQTPRFNANVGCYATRYLSVQVGNKEITSGVSGLVARNGSQKAGLDHNGKVVIF